MIGNFTLPLSAGAAEVSNNYGSCAEPAPVTVTSAFDALDAMEAGAAGHGRLVSRRVDALAARSGAHYRHAFEADADSELSGPGPQHAALEALEEGEADEEAEEEKERSGPLGKRAKDMRDGLRGGMFPTGEPDWDPAPMIIFCVICFCFGLMFWACSRKLER